MWFERKNSPLLGNPSRWQKMNKIGKFLHIPFTLGEIITFLVSLVGLSGLSQWWLRTLTNLWSCSSIMFDDTDFNDGESLLGEDYEDNYGDFLETFTDEPETEEFVPSQQSFNIEDMTQHPSLYNGKT